MYMHELMVEDSVYHTIKREVEEVANYLERHRHSLNAAEKAVAREDQLRQCLEPWFDAYRQLAEREDELFDTVERRRFFELNAPLLFDNLFTERRSNLNYYQGLFNSTLSRLAELKDRMSHYPEDYSGDKRFTKPEMVRALSGIDNLDPRTVALGKDNDGGFVRWVFQGLLMSPDQHGYDAVPQGIKIALQPIVVKAYLGKNQVTMLARPGEDHLCAYPWEGKNRVHPHVIGRDQPCLGDYTAPIYDAIHSGDWSTAATLLRLFLQGAVHADAAGRHWVYGLRELNGPVGQFARVITPDYRINYKGQYGRLIQDPAHPGYVLFTAD